MVVAPSILRILRSTVWRVATVVFDVNLFNPPSVCRKIDVQRQSYAMQLAIGVLASIVLMHIVRIKLEAPSNREQTAHVDFCSAPFFILALVVHLYARVWGWVIGAYYSWFLYFKLVTIAPLKSSITPIESGLPVSDILQRIPKRVT